MTKITMPAMNRQNSNHSGLRAINSSNQPESCNKKDCLLVLAYQSVTIIPCCIYYPVSHVSHLLVLSHKLLDSLNVLLLRIRGAQVLDLGPLVVLRLALQTEHIRQLLSSPAGSGWVIP
jgi:hypothetical protein